MVDDWHRCVRAERPGRSRTGASAYGVNANRPKPGCTRDEPSRAPIGTWGQRGPAKAGLRGVVNGLRVAGCAELPPLSNATHLPDRRIAPQDQLGTRPSRTA